MQKNKKIKLLDCTLRDGGSVNKWNFGADNIINILQNLNEADIDIVEIGFLQDNYPNSKNLTISEDTSSFDEKLSQISDKHFKSVAMIDYGKYDIDKLPDKQKTLIDGIRLMFKKEQLNDAFEYSKKIMDKGYSLSLNPVSVTTYNEADIESLCAKANSLNPDIVYIIDTYGLLNREQTLNYYNLFENNLNQNIEIGYHAHNNLQLAFSNSIEIINNAKRGVVIDGSLYGMGKRAGNTPVELLINYLNLNYYGNYNLDNVGNIIDSIIIPMHRKFEWGYSLLHYIAAINLCHSDYVTYLYKEKQCSVEEINHMLKLIKTDKKLTFDKNYIEKLYGEIKNAKYVCGKA